MKKKEIKKTKASVSKDKNSEKPKKKCEFLDKLDNIIEKTNN